MKRIQEARHESQEFQFTRGGNVLNLKSKHKHEGSATRVGVNGFR